MRYLVTGATGFIGRHLVERLLARDDGGEIAVLVRRDSTDKLERIRARHWNGSKRIKPIVGDLQQPRLGVSPATARRLKGTVDHFFHLAAIYDMTASDARNEELNVRGTEHAIELANALDAGIFHHVSSVAVAGTHRGHFDETMFDVGQPLPHPYFRTKFEAERLARTLVDGAWRVYRPSIVVGHSQTGAIDKIDGPYYFFKLLQRLRGILPQWLPLVGLDVGRTNIVPVDYVAAALDHLAHLEGRDGEAFHLVAPKAQKVADVMDALAYAAHLPRSVVHVDSPVAELVPTGALRTLADVPGVGELLSALGIPAEVLEHVRFQTRFEAQITQQALAGSDIEVPSFESYAQELWDYWERHLDPGRHQRIRRLSRAVDAKRIVITGGSDGIGKAAALKLGAAGGVPLLVARSPEKLEAVKREVEQVGGTAYAYSADLSDYASIDALAERLLAEHTAIDVLVNNAGRSIRRSVALSYDRFHDFERTIQLNYLGALRLILALLPHMRARRQGHVINISSIGVQASPPRFSAYVASKAALDAFTRVVASEAIGDDVHFTTIHMPLVRTKMIAPTRMYDAFPTISPDQAADLIGEAIRDRPKAINTTLGTAAEVLYALAPKISDRILHLAYQTFPDSAAARGATDNDEQPSAEGLALARLFRGIHW